MNKEMWYEMIEKERHQYWSSFTDAEKVMFLMLISVTSEEVLKDRELMVKPWTGYIYYKRGLSRMHGLMNYMGIESENLKNYVDKVDDSVNDSIKRLSNKRKNGFFKILLEILNDCPFSLTHLAVRNSIIELAQIYQYHFSDEEYNNLMQEFHKVIIKESLIPVIAERVLRVVKHGRHQHKNNPKNIMDACALICVFLSRKGFIDWKDREEYLKLIGEIYYAYYPKMLDLNEANSVHNSMLHEINVVNDGFSNHNQKTIIKLLESDGGPDRFDAICDPKKIIIEFPYPIQDVEYCIKRKNYR